MITLMEAGVILVVVFDCIGIVTVVFAIVDYYVDKRIYQRITFKKFKELYEASPGRWELNRSVVRFVKKIEDDIVFSFTLMDRCRYYKWHRALDKQQRNERYSKELQEVIAAIQVDKEK